MTTTKTIESAGRATKDQVTAPAGLITGALTGIGRAAALAFAREGARIVVSGRHDDKGKALVSELQEIGAEAKFRGPDSDAETLSGFAEYIGQHSKTRKDIKTWFDAFDLDDFVSFGGKP
jgi:NAD(P)-dependent dehydrogenase (short-subunit alcohol dehydrogenase family)